MDPNNPGQNPGVPSPPPADPWGQPSAPQPSAPQPPADPWSQQPQQPPADPWSQQPAPQQPASPWSQPTQPVQPPADPWSQQPQPPAGEPWGQPPQPPAGEPWGQPPAPDQPGYGVPPQWGTPQPGMPPTGMPQPGMPPAGMPPYGAPPAWGVPPAAPRRSRLPVIIGAVVAIVVIGAIVAAIGLSNAHAHAGQVVFTTTAPTADGAKTCQIGDTVTSVSLGQPVYAIYFYKNRLSNETVTLTILKDGTQVLSTPLTSDESNGVDCLEDYSNLGDILTATGSYEFKLTTSSGDVVSDGTLVIK